MVRRHPHVFGESAAADAQSIQADWEHVKAVERAGAGGAEAGGVLAGVARALPALVRAQKLQRRAARVGFDWDEVAGVFDKVREELAECEQALADPADDTAQVHEVGDLLFACVNLARHLGIDAEQALRTANRRFETRSARVEAGLRAQGRAPDPAVRAEMERLWGLAKVEEQKGCAS